MKKNIKNDNKNIKKKKYRVKIKVVLFSFFFLIFLIAVINNFINTRITNIYVTGNKYLTDWEIIELAKLNEYPNSLANSTKTITKRIEKSSLISNVKVRKKYFSIVYIEIIENRPLFYSQENDKTILADGTKANSNFNVPILVSNLDDEMYKEFLSKMSKISIDVLNKMSEIKYFPDEVDKERFIVTMTDGNYVYLTLNKFTLINDYNSIVKEFNNKKGILFLNSGGYFKIMEN